MDRLRQLEVFVRTAELGSLSQAAQALGMSNAAVSRHLATLEERVAVRLIERNTRRLWLTEATILAELAEAEDALTEKASSPRGLLRITSSLSFAMIHIAPSLPRFRVLYPDLDVQITAANRYPDFIEAGIDVAIRTREQEPDTNIVVRRLGRVRRLLAAAPEYLARRGTPRSPAELSEHDMLVYNLAHEPYSLRLKRGSTAKTIRIRAALDSNDGQIIRQAGLAGAGILIQPLYIIHSDVEAGRLVPVLTDWALPLLTMNVAYQNRERVPGKIRVFTEFLMHQVKENSPRNIWFS